MGQAVGDLRADRLRQRRRAGWRRRAEASSLPEYLGRPFDPGLSWDDVAWGERWSGPIVLNAIQTVADAVTAADNGVEAIAVSNHGGR
ncbi:MAG: alpha-hydroxy-acid oxidizing protein [Acidimicrobiia bacterium]|nr:alpha-hydroxy-acid oxidizing protein [Acidimicrobiia bacterium]